MSNTFRADRIRLYVTIKSLSDYSTSLWNLYAGFRRIRLILSRASVKKIDPHSNSLTKFNPYSTIASWKTTIEKYLLKIYYKTNQVILSLDSERQF